MAEAGIIFEHSLEFPTELREALAGAGKVNIRQTFRDTVRVTYRRVLERAARQISSAYSDYPSIGPGVGVQQVSTSETIEFSIESENPNIFFLDYDIPPHQLPPNPNVPIDRLIDWAHSLGYDTSFAYYVADKIAEEGFMHPGHEGRGVIDRVMGAAEAELAAREATAVGRWAERYGVVATPEGGG
jgi:hypothetical protein